MKKLYHMFFYIPKYEKVPQKVFVGRTVLSALTILVCMIVLCAATFAYFNDTVSSTGNTIVAATYDLTITDAQNNTVSNTYLCPLVPGDLHRFTLSANSSADTGYCKIEIANGEKTQTYFTTQIYKAADEAGDRPSSITLAIVAAKGSTITFTPQWGTSANYAVDQDNIYTDNATISHSNTPYVTCVITDGLTLDAIAQHYGVAAADILTFNGITELSAVGEEIRIPGTTVTSAPVMLSEDENGAQDCVVHTVAEGETLSDIAVMYETTVAAVCEYNGIGEDTVLVAGQTIAIPKNTGTDTEDPDMTGEQPENIDPDGDVTVTDPGGDEAVTDPTLSTEPAEDVAQTTEPETATEPEATEEAAEQTE